MAVVINSQDCDKSQLGTGVIDCIIKEGIPRGFIAVQKGWSILLSETLDLVNLVQTGVAIPFLQGVEFTDNTPENTIEEYQGGLKNVVRNGLPEFAFKFVKGYAPHKAFFSYNSLNAYDFLLVFDSGTVMGAVSKDGLSLKGFSGGMLNTASYKFNDGAVSANSMVAFQLTNANEFNKSGALLTAENLGIDVNSELFGIIDAVVTVTGASAGDPITVTVKALQNVAFDIEGLASTNFRLKINGTVDTIVSSVYADGVYTITPTTATTATNAVIVELYDATESVAVAKVGNKLFKGVSSAFTVTA